MRIESFVEYLGLKHTFEIQLRNTSKDIATAEYWCIRNEKGKIKKHVIRVYLLNIWGNPAERDLETIIAHELIHAWQDENGFGDIHGDSFQQIARSMSIRFSLPNIYDPERDID